MDNLMNLLESVDLNLNNGKCLDIVKQERDNLKDAIMEGKENGMSFDYGVDLIRRVHAFDILIENFEKYLGHER